MSGTSLDGVDAVVVEFCATSPRLLQTSFIPYDACLRDQLLALHQPGNNELHRASILSNKLSHLYAKAVTSLLKSSCLEPQNIVAIGCHGQTIRHCPESVNKYTIQLVNASLLAELTRITTVVDFRSRDIAAGGQGAPLVPAFHQAVFNAAGGHRAIVNIGGISNITYLEQDKSVIGFDCGPGNLLMDAWCLLHTGNTYDKNGLWAASGRVIPGLLEKFFTFWFFSLLPPKSTGREMFSMEWLESHLLGNEKPEDVQATLLQLTVKAIASSIFDFCINAEDIYICGGGAHNSTLISHLKQILPDKTIELTDRLGIDADWVEAFAFAWLARQTILGIPSNLPAVTGARESRILGAIYQR